MKYLLDTHTFLWFLSANPELSQKAREIILNQENSCFISIASFWEIAIKFSLKKLQLEIGIDEILTTDVFPTIPIKKSHLKEISNMIFYHRDPFDRLLISQSIVEKMTLISKDEKFKDYNIPNLW